MDIEKEIAETVAALPNEPQDQVLEKLLQNGMLSKNVLVYKVAMPYEPLEERTVKMIHGHCTACGEEMYLEYVKEESGCWRAGGVHIGFKDPITGEFVGTGMTTVCPRCGSRVQAIHISNINNYYSVEEQYSVTGHNIRNHFCLLSWIIVKYCDKEGKIGYEPRKYGGIMLIGNKPIRIAGHTRTANGYESFFSKWVARKTFCDEIGWCGRNTPILFAPEDLWESDATNSAFDNYVECLSQKGQAFRPVAYLQLWCKHPQVENLVRQNCGRIVSDIIDRCTTSSYYVQDKLDVKKTDEFIEWKRTKPHQMLRIEKEEMKFALANDFDTLEIYVFCKNERGVKLNPIDLKKARKIGERELIRALKEPHHGYTIPVLRFINYITKQRNIHRGRASLVGVRYVLDYWDMLHKVYGAMEPSLLYPKNIVEAHDQMSLRVEEKENRELDEKIHNRFLELEQMEFHDEKTGLLIRPCASHAEIINEGKQLQHCVGGYAKSYANGSTNILFIRKIAEPDKPFFTLEFRDGKVAQNRGFKNCNRTQEVVEFEEKWLEFIEGGKKNGKHGSRKESLAGA